jgi:tRNA G18 (ribose-2'-O)-methylase SpoU
MEDSREDFVHQRHKPPTPLERPRELIVACPPLRSNVNLSRIVRTAGCAGIGRIICCGTAKVLGKIARDGAEAVALEVHRTLPPVLEKLKREGYRLVALEQTTSSRPLVDFPFERKTVLVVGNERTGLEDDVLRLVDDVVEIPVFGMPYSHNVATAAAIAIYEYCRRFPDG